MFLVAQSLESKCKHVLAMNLVREVQVALPYLKIWQRYCKIIHHYILEEMVLTIVHELVESAVSLVLPAQLNESQSLIEDLVWLGIVVVHGCSWLLRPLGSPLPAHLSLFHLARSFVSATQEVIEVVLLGTIKFAFTQMMRILQTLL